MTTVTVKGQVTIPKHIRKKLGIVPGAQISFIEQNDKVIIKSQQVKNPFEKWVGYLKTSKYTDQTMTELRGHHE